MNTPEDHSKSLSFESKLIAYSTAVGASFVMGQAVQADVIYFEGPWTATGTDTPLISFNLAGDVATDGSHVANEQFFFGNRPFSSTQTGGGGGGGTTFKPGGGGTIFKPGGGGTPGGFMVNGNALYIQGAGDAGALLNPYGSMGIPGPAAPPAAPIPVSYAGYDILLSPTAIIVDAGAYGTKQSPASFGSSGLLALREQIQPTGGGGTTKIPPSLKTTPLPFPGGTKGTALGSQTFAGGVVPFGTEAYLGLRFDAPGDDFFMGWAGIILNNPDSLTLTGYAYEDSGAPIRLGDTGEPPIETPEPGTLSLLALGATGLAILRRRRRSNPPQGSGNGATVH